LSRAIAKTGQMAEIAVATFMGFEQLDRRSVQPDVLDYLLLLLLGDRVIFIIIIIIILLSSSQNSRALFISYQINRYIFLFFIIPVLFFFLHSPCRRCLNVPLPKYHK